VGSNVSPSQAAISDLNDVSTSYFFVRQLGNTFGVTTANGDNYGPENVGTETHLPDQRSGSTDVSIRRFLGVYG
jgi:hypothetical protein